MLWKIFAAACGSLQAAKSTVIKKTLHTTGDHWATLCANYLWALPVLIAYWLTKGHPVAITDPSRLSAILGALVVAELIAQFSYNRLLVAHPLSRIMPFLRLTGAVTFISYALIKHRTIDASAAIGITLVCVGLTLIGREKGENIERLRIGDGVKIAVVVIMWSITTILQKEGIAAAGDVSRFALWYVGLSALAAIMLREIFSSRSEVGPGALTTSIGVIGGLSYLCQYISIELAPNPGFVLAWKDSASALVSLLSDKYVFCTRIGLLRIMANALCVAGSIIIGFARSAL